MHGVAIWKKTWKSKLQQFDKEKQDFIIPPSQLWVYHFSLPVSPGQSSMDWKPVSSRAQSMLQKTYSISGSVRKQGIVYNLSPSISFFSLFLSGPTVAIAAGDNGRLQEPELRDPLLNCGWCLSLIWGILKHYVSNISSVFFLFIIIINFSDFP